MDFGQSTDPIELSGLTMRLPPCDSDEERAQMARLKRASERSQASQKLFVGAPIWSHAPWVGNFYPEGTPSTSFLKEYGKQLGTVEVNSTFYAIPSEETFKKWKESVDENFRFCPKFPKSISHSLNPEHPDLKIFTERVLSLGDRLGVCFLQLPQYLSPGEKPRLERLFQALPRELKTVVEFRNPEFFESQRLKAEWVDLLAKNFLGTVSVDTPLERAVAHASISSTRVMVRFLGGNLHDTDFKRLEEWTERVALWLKNGMKEIYFLVHEPENTLATEATARLIELMNTRLHQESVSLKLVPIQWNHLL